MPVSGAWTYTESGGNATITGYSTGVGGFDPVIPTTLDGYPVTNIGASAMNNISLNSVTFNHVVTIGISAFDDNSGISVTVSADILSGVPIFERCNIGSGLTISSGVTSISGGMFQDSGVTSVSFPSTLTTIGGSSFRSCPITSLTLPSSLTTISTRAFQDCSITSLTLDIPNLVLGSICFQNNPITSLTLDADVDTSALIYDGDSPFALCTIGSGLTITSNVTTIPQFLFAYSGITTLTLSNVIELGSRCFSNCASIVLTLDANITTTGLSSSVEAPFYEADLQGNVTITSNVTTIPKFLFVFCGLDSIDFPSSVTNIGQECLKFNDTLVSIYFRATSTITFGTGVLDGCEPSPKGTIYSNESSVQTWWTANYTTYYNFSAISGRLKYWNGSAWELKPLKYWNGSAWEEKPLKYYNGSWSV